VRVGEQQEEEQREEEEEEEAGPRGATRCILLASRRAGSLFLKYSIIFVLE
jgi:hypothetical protein